DAEVRCRVGRSARAEAALKLAGDRLARHLDARNISEEIARHDAKRLLMFCGLEAEIDRRRRSIDAVVSDRWRRDDERKEEGDPREPLHFFLLAARDFSG